MKQRIGWMVLLVMVIPVAGCDALLDFFLPSTVTVMLVNGSTDFNVDGTLFYDDDEDIFEVLLTQIGTERNFSLSPGETATFTRNCDDLGAIVVDEAELQAILIQPSADTEVFRMGEDFECGQVIEFTFSHSPLFIDFDVDVAILSPL